MKKVIPLLFLLILINSCKSQPKEFSLIGKWQCIEEHGSNGASPFVTKVKDGDVLVFGPDSTATDKNGNKGSYSLDGDHLHVTLPDGERFYILYKIKDDFERMSLSPVSSEYQIICDEGCAFIYEKTD